MKKILSLAMCIIILSGAYSVNVQAKNETKTKTYDIIEDVKSIKELAKEQKLTEKEKKERVDKINACNIEITKDGVSELLDTSEYEITYLKQLSSEKVVNSEVIEAIYVDTYILTPISATEILGLDKSNIPDGITLVGMVASLNDPVSIYDSSLSVELMINLVYSWLPMTSGGIEHPISVQGKVTRIMDSSVSVSNLVINYKASGDSYINGTGTRIQKKEGFFTAYKSNPITGVTYSRTANTDNRYWHTDNGPTGTYIFYNSVFTLKRGTNTWNVTVYNWRGDYADPI